MKAAEILPYDCRHDYASEQHDPKSPLQASCADFRITYHSTAQSKHLPEVWVVFAVEGT